MTSKKQSSSRTRKEMPKDEDNFWKKFENILDEQMNKLIVDFTKKLDGVKNEIIANTKKTGIAINVQSDSFMQKLNNLFNFDSLLEIIQEKKKDEQICNSISQRINEYLKQIEVKQEDKHELKELAKTLNSYEKLYLSTTDAKKEELLEDFRTSIPFQIIPELFNKLFESNIETNWKWNPNKKSTETYLLENNTKAVKHINAAGGYTALLGDVEMSVGHYEWRLNVSTKNSTRYWISFGIVDKKCITNLEKFPFTTNFG